MGIDGINKPGAGPGFEVDKTAGKSNAEFSVDAPAKALVDDAANISSESPLQQVSAGTLSVDAYLELQVTQAVQHLAGKLPQEQLDFVRQTLREQLAEDPVLVELVRRTTGSAPTK